MTSLKILVFLLLLLIHENLHWLFMAIRAGIRISDTNVEDAHPPLLPEAMDANISARPIDRGRSGLLLLLPVATVLLLLGRLLLLLGRLRRQTGCGGWLLSSLSSNLTLQTANAIMDVGLALYPGV